MEYTGFLCIRIQQIFSSTHLVCQTMSTYRSCMIFGSDFPYKPSLRAANLVSVRL
jgi:hypothetical protein